MRPITFLLHTAPNRVGSVALVLAVATAALASGCGPKPPEVINGPRAPQFNVTNTWQFSTAFSSSLVCIWALDLQMDPSGSITGTGIQGFITLFAGPEGQITAMYGHPVEGQVSGASVSLKFNACDDGTMTYSGSLLSDSEMSGSNWQAEVMPLPPSAPTNLQATYFREPAGTDAVEWTWQDNSDDETGFRLQYTSDPEPNPLDVYERDLPANTTSDWLSAIPPGRVIHFRVAAFKNAGRFGTLWSNYSEWHSSQAP
jgi:hypothetical protein